MLGKYELNKIYNEDSYKAIKDIPDKSIDCIYTDVPYLYQKGGVGLSALGDRMKLKGDDLENISDGFNYDILNDFVRILKKVNLFIWCSDNQILDIMTYFKDYNYKLLTWNKTNPSPTTNNSWLPDIEYCFHIREKGVKMNNGYDLKSKWHTTSINKRDKDLFNHPTIKPLDLVKRHLKHATQENDIVADFFIGSGTTAVAAKELNRNFIGFEKVKKWHTIAVDRLNGITANGQTSIFTDFNKFQETI
jgi:DNA modification methylase